MLFFLITYKIKKNILFLTNYIFINKINQYKQKNIAFFMEKNKSVVEETLLQIKAIEEAISENAKGILASTMKEEISELVKESLKGKKSLHEQGEAPEGDDETEVEDEDIEDYEVEDEDVEDTDLEDDVEEPEMPDAGLEGDNQMEMPPLDMTQASAEEVLRVFKAMGDQDGIIIKKQDDGDIHLVDNNSNTEYLISFGGESIPNEQTNMMENYMDETIYELETEDDYGFEDEEEDYEMYEEDMNPEMYEEDSMYEEGDMYEEDENVYEIDQEQLESVLESFKAKGMGMGKPKTGMSKSSVNMKGFKESMKSGGKGKTGNGPKFKYPSIKHGVTETETDEMEEGWMDEDYLEDGMLSMDEMDMDTETTEASRTLGNGKYWGRKGLPKPKSAPRHLKVESIEAEVNLLREKNEEYKKALNFFRNKLDEVATFNSNLAYSTRLFTEHSTTKQEKINILRRFDNVESIKESKNLYKTIKEELEEGKGNGSINESVQRTVVRTPKTGSSTNLIESKTYENPQFLRMKDLMTKIK
jgi:hypothetical protein